MTCLEKLVNRREKQESVFSSECGVGVRVFFIIHIPRSRVWFIAPSYHHIYFHPGVAAAKVKRTKGFDLRKTHACRNLQQGGIRNHRKSAVGCWQIVKHRTEKRGNPRKRSESRQASGIVSGPSRALKVRRRLVVWLVVLIIDIESAGSILSSKPQPSKYCIHFNSQCYQKM